jgi:AcrR family transcriptional regulator
METTERRKQILDAAKQVFAEKSYHGAWVADVVQRAGIARGTFYLYFKGKAEVFDAVIDEMLLGIKVRLIPIRIDRPEEILATLFGNFETVQRFLADDPALARIIIREATSLDESASQRIRELRKGLTRWVAALIRQFQEAGILRPLDADIVACAFVGAIRELAEQGLFIGEARLDSTRLADVVMNVFIFGILAPEYSRLAQDHMLQIRPRAFPPVVGQAD